MTTSHASLRARAQQDHERKVARVGKTDGRATASMVRRAMVQHEDALHGGKHEKLKLATGGAAMGDEGMAKPRLDRAKPKKPGKGANVNVIVANAPKEKEPVPVPVPAMGAPKPPMAPPPAPAPMAGPGGPPGGMPPRPPIAAGAAPMMPRKSGGRTGYAKGGAVKIDDGAGSGEGRLEKIKEYGANADIGRGANRKRGGKC